MFTKLLDSIFGKRCPNCGSRNRTHSIRLNRGYNDWCSQAYASCGYICQDCVYIEWDDTLEDHMKTLPPWCKPRMVGSDKKENLDT